MHVGKRERSIVCDPEKFDGHLASRISWVTYIKYDIPVKNISASETAQIQSSQLQSIYRDTLGELLKLKNGTYDFIIIISSC